MNETPVNMAAILNKCGADSDEDLSSSYADSDEEQITSWKESGDEQDTYTAEP